MHPERVQVTVFTGEVRPLPASGRPTAIYKTPITAPFEVGSLGLAGDHQADTRVHGGPDKAIHLYPSAHYARLADAFPEASAALQPGSMGENLATDALDERGVRIGDIWQLGTAHIQVCQPRNPCWKIDERFEAEGMAQFVDKAMLTGWYWRVLRSGVVGPTDQLTLLEPNQQATSLHDAMRLWREHRPDLGQLAQLAETVGIAANWQYKIRQRLANLKKLA